MSDPITTKRLQITINEIRSSRSITCPHVRVSFGGHFYKDTQFSQFSSASPSPSLSLSSSSPLSSPSLLTSKYLNDFCSLDKFPILYAWSTLEESSSTYFTPPAILSNISSFIFGRQDEEPCAPSFIGKSFSFPLTEHGILFDSISINIYENCLIGGSRLIGSLLIALSQQTTSESQWKLMEPRSNTTCELLISFSIQITEEEPSFISSSAPLMISHSSAKLPVWLRPLRSFLDEDTVNLGIMTLLKMLDSFGQGLESYSHASILGSLLLLSRFETWKRRQNLYSLSNIYGNPVIQEQKILDISRHLFKFAMSAYGWKGLTLLGRRSFQSILSSPNSEKSAILSYLNLRECDLLHITRSNGIFQPHCVIFYDGRSPNVSSIVIALRGSLSATDWMTSFGGEYAPWGGGFVHSGVAKAANYVIKEILPIAIRFARQLGVGRITITGHSLGGATALLALLFAYHDEKEEEEEAARISIDAMSFGAPPIVSAELLPLFQGLQAVSYIFGNDVVPRISYGSLMDYRKLIVKATAHVSFRNIFSSSFNANSSSRLMMFRVLLAMEQQSVLTSAYPKLYVPGRILYIYDVENNAPVDMSNIATSSPVLRSADDPLKFHRFTAVTECDPLLFGQFFIQTYMIAHHSPLAYDDALYNASQSILRGAIPVHNKHPL